MKRHLVIIVCPYACDTWPLWMLVWLYIVSNSLSLIIRGLYLKWHCLVSHFCLHFYFCPEYIWEEALTIMSYEVSTQPQWHLITGLLVYIFNKQQLRKFGFLFFLSHFLLKNNSHWWDYYNVVIITCCIELNSFCLEFDNLLILIK